MLEDRLWKCWKRKTSQIADTTFSDPLNHLPDTLDCHLRRAQSASRSKPSPKAVAGRRKSAEAVDESETGSANFFGPKASTRRRRTGGPMSCAHGAVSLVLMRCTYDSQLSNQASRRSSGRSS